MIEQEFGRTVREIRIKNNLTQEKLSELSGLDRRYIQRIEKGEKDPSLSSILKLSTGLNISAPELLRLFIEKVSS